LEVCSEIFCSRKKVREDAVAKAAAKIEITKVDVVIKQSLTFEKGQVVVEEMAIPALIAVAQVIRARRFARLLLAPCSLNGHLVSVLQLMRTTCWILRR